MIGRAREFFGLYDVDKATPLIYSNIVCTRSTFTTMYRGNVMRIARNRRRTLWPMNHHRLLVCVCAIYESTTRWSAEINKTNLLWNEKKKKKKPYTTIKVISRRYTTLEKRTGHYCDSVWEHYQVLMRYQKKKNVKNPDIYDVGTPGLMPYKHELRKIRDWRFSKEELLEGFLGRARRPTGGWRKRQSKTPKLQKKSPSEDWNGQ